MVRLRRLVATGTIAALIAALWLASPVMWQSVAHANSADATLSVLLVKNETHLWVIAPPDTTWDVDVPNFVSAVTVDALPSNSQASYVVRFDGATAPDGEVSLSVGSNIITVEVTAEDRETTETYTVTVTRAENMSATGAPTISGTAQVGQTLTADTSGISDADGLGNVTYGYQWLADDTEIDGATGSTYTLQASDNGKAIKVRVTFTDGAGNEESLTSAATEAVVMGGCERRGRARRAGVRGRLAQRRVGELNMRTTAIGAGKTEGMFGWRMRLLLAAVLAGVTGLIWLQGLEFVDAQGADPLQQGYMTVVVADDLSDADNPATSLTIDFHTTIACSRGDYNAYISNVIDFIDGIPKRHLGSAASHDVQITSTISDLQGKGLTFDVEVRCGRDPGRLSSYVSIPHDESSTSTGSNRRLAPGTYSSEPPLTSLTVSHGALDPTFHSHTTIYTVPDIANANDRMTLTTTAKDGYSIVFVKGATYTIHDCPLGGRCTVTYKDADGDSVDPLTDADTDTDGFQVDLDEGENVIMVHVYRELVHRKFYRLTVTRAANSVATGAPTISGTAQVGQTLTADTSGIADEDGLTGVAYSYQWLADGADISGATSSSYTLVTAQQGKTIQVRVTFTDDAGNEESLTSAATDTVVMGGL